MRTFLFVLNIVLIILCCATVLVSNDPFNFLVNGIIIGANIVMAVHNAQLISFERHCNKLVAEAKQKLDEHWEKLNSNE